MSKNKSFYDLFSNSNEDMTSPFYDNDFKTFDGEVEIVDITSLPQPTSEAEDFGIISFLFGPSRFGVFES